MRVRWLLFRLWLPWWLFRLTRPGEPLVLDWRLRRWGRLTDPEPVVKPLPCLDLRPVWVPEWVSCLGCAGCFRARAAVETRDYHASRYEQLAAELAS